MAHPKFEEVRRLYNFACGYCQVSEESTAGELTIDHYKPQVENGGDEIENLVYACFRCNLHKHDFWPNNDDIAAGRRILHPRFDDIEQHIILNSQTGWLDALTETGRFHITVLHLNRPQLVRHRLAKQMDALLEEKQRLLEQQVVELQKTIASQQRYIQTLSAQIQ